MDAPSLCTQRSGITPQSDLGSNSMRFFRRKRSDDDETERCPRCSEPVPEGAAECMMCGLPLEPFRAALSSEEAETQTADRPNG
jgi:predicted amidophosphoribosyltransferase